MFLPITLHLLLLSEIAHIISQPSSRLTEFNHFTLADYGL